MSAETKDNNQTFFRKPNGVLLAVSSLVIIYAVCCVVVLILTTTGHLLNSHSFDCGDSIEFVSRLKIEVYWWSALNLLVCIFLLLEVWRRKGFYLLVVLAMAVILVIMISSFATLKTRELQEMEKFKKHYLALLPLTDSLQETTNSQLTDTDCHVLSYVNRWQTEFHCCGLEGYQDWNSSIPESCLCDGEGGTTDCVAVGDSHVYGKPCLPTVLSLVEKHSSTYWIVLTVWLTVAGAPYAAMIFYCCWCSCCFLASSDENLSYWKYKWTEGKGKVPVVFIRKNNNNHIEEESTEEKKAKESIMGNGVILDIKDGTNKEGEEGEPVEDDTDDNPVRLIPLSLLKTLQAELDPPPVQHRVLHVHNCLLDSYRKKSCFYTVLIEEDSPLLPSNAVLVDANKPTKRCFWLEGGYDFSVDYIVWPQLKLQGYPLPAISYTYEL